MNKIFNKKLSVIFFLIIIYGQLSAQVQNFGDDNGTSVYTFGIRLVTTPNSVGQYFLILTNGKKIERTTPISRIRFIRQAMGIEESVANPTKRNLFVKYNVYDSVKIMSEVIASINPKPDDEKLYNYKKRTRFNNRIEFLAKNTTGQLWKLRYASYPYMSSASDTTGWTMNYANPYMPTKAQMQILKGYGLETINGYIYGENLFRLLKDIQNKQWVEAYKQAQDQ